MLITCVANAAPQMPSYRIVPDDIPRGDAATNVSGACGSSAAESEPVISFLTALDDLLPHKRALALACMCVAGVAAAPRCRAASRRSPAGGVKDHGHCIAPALLS